MASMMVPLTTVGADFSLERFQLVLGDVKVSLLKMAYGTTFINLNEWVTTMDLRLDATSTILPLFLTPMLTTPQRPLRTSSGQTVMTFNTAIPTGGS